MVSSWIVAGAVIGRTRVPLLVHACHEYAVQWSFARRHFLRRVPVMFLHTRLSFMTASLIALGGFFQVSPSMAATSIDPGIYSGAPFAFKVDPGIFS